MKPRYVLHYAPDNASQPVAMTLEALGAPYERRLVDRAARAQKSPAYLQLNPHGLIPVLETSDGPLWETGACLLWLADRHGRLAPAPDSRDRAALLKWLFFTSGTLHTDLIACFYPDRYGPPEAVDRIYALTTARTAGHWSRIEAAVDGIPGLSADDPGILAYYLASLARWSSLYPAERDRSWFDYAALPRLHRVFAALEKTAAVQTIIAREGLNDRPFTAPAYANPPEGSAT